MVHRQYLCNTHCTHNLLVGWNKCPIGPRDDGYLTEESLGLRAKTFFDGFSDLILVCEPGSLQCFFSCPNTWEIAGRQVGAVGGLRRTHRKCCSRSLQTFATWRALSCNRITPYDIPRLRFLMAVFSLRKVSQNAFALTVPPVSNISKNQGANLVKKNTWPSLSLLKLKNEFFGRGEPECRHSILICFVAGSKKWY